jgi:hypothetical protein
MLTLTPAGSMRTLSLDPAEAPVAKPPSATAAAINAEAATALGLITFIFRPP